MDDGRLTTRVGAQDANGEEKLERAYSPSLRSGEHGEVEKREHVHTEGNVGIRHAVTNEGTRQGVVVVNHVGLRGLYLVLS